MEYSVVCDAARMLLALFAFSGLMTARYDIHCICIYFMDVLELGIQAAEVGDENVDYDRFKTIYVTRGVTVTASHC